MPIQNMKATTALKIAGVILILGLFTSAAILIGGVISRAELSAATRAAEAARQDEQAMLELLSRGLPKDQATMYEAIAMDMALADDKHYPGLVGEMKALLRDLPEEERVTRMRAAVEASAVLYHARKTRMQAELNEHRLWKAARRYSL